MNKQEIQNFENEIAEVYKQGKIHAPIHLSGHGEDELMQIFKNIDKKDWILSTWRSHYHWLLSGRDPEQLKKQILEGHSMHIFGTRFFTSAIVGGIAPIAVGIAWALQRKKPTEMVWCFLGDMGASCGIAKESIAYAQGHDLPIVFVIEDNGLSVRVDTKDVWGKAAKNKVISYKYIRKHNHAGYALNGEKGYVLF